MRSIRIDTAGPHTTIQDKGRGGYQALGMPEGGVLDRDAMRLGNALVGNPEEAAVLEICLGGLGVELLAPARVALTGTGEGHLVVSDDSGMALQVPANRSVDLIAGQKIRLGPLTDTNTVTLAVSGGIATPLLYGSRGTSPNAGIGGVDGGVLKDGMILPLGDPAETEAPEWQGGDLMTGDVTMIRACAGPQDDRFTEEALALFFEAPFTVTPMLNRMGMRLEGPGLRHIDNADIPSDGIVTGSVQVPGNGQPIILLADHQTTGGYTKIATVISTDLPRLARLRPGTAVHFTQVTVAEAETIARDHEARVQAMLARLAPAPAMFDQAALYRLGDTT
ncbi:MAG: biotin-dependent carboxyltransferase family protein [Candidatus Puniceispirillales bacterium]